MNKKDLLQQMKVSLYILGLKFTNTRKDEYLYESSMNITNTILFLYLIMQILLPYKEVLLAYNKKCFLSSLILFWYILAIAAMQVFALKIKSKSFILFFSSHSNWDSHCKVTKAILDYISILFCNISAYLWSYECIFLSVICTYSAKTF